MLNAGHSMGHGLRLGLDASIEDQQRDLNQELPPPLHQSTLLHIDIRVVAEAEEEVQDFILNETFRL